MNRELRSYFFSRIKWGLLGGLLFSLVTFHAVEGFYEEEHYRLMNLQCRVQASMESSSPAPCNEAVIGEAVTTLGDIKHVDRDLGFIF